MKIIREGSLEFAKKLIRFECKECKTIFEADKGEYEYCGCQIEGDEWKAECPLCHNTVYAR
jgi:hypothetical protein|nr:MAG TPA: Transcription initiation factor IIE, alpha FINGER, Transcription [Caudoviricetes sp.]